MLVSLDPGGMVNVGMVFCVLGAIGLVVLIIRKKLYYATAATLTVVGGMMFVFLAIRGVSPWGDPFRPPTRCVFAACGVALLLGFALLTVWFRRRGGRREPNASRRE